MFQHANPTKVIPDLIKLITGASVSFPDYPNQLLLQGSLHSPPPFFSTSKTHASKEEKCWDNSTFQKQTAGEKQKSGFV